MFKFLNKSENHEEETRNKDVEYFETLYKEITDFTKNAIISIKKIQLTLQMIELFEENSTIQLYYKDLLKYRREQLNNLIEEYKNTCKKYNNQYKKLSENGYTFDGYSLIDEDDIYRKLDIAMYIIYEK